MQNPCGASSHHPRSLPHLPEGDVLVGRARREPQHARRPVGALGVPLDLVGGRDLLVDQVVVQDVELVPLDGLRGRVVVVVVRLVVLVPLIAWMGRSSSSSWDRRALISTQKGHKEVHEPAVTLLASSELTSVDSVEVLGFPRLVLLVPPVNGALQRNLASKLTVLLVAAHELQSLSRDRRTS